MAAATADLDERDRELLTILGKGFPLETRPFLSIGNALSMGEGEVTKRVQRLTDSGYISRIGAIIDPRKVGFTSTLVAARVPPEKLERVVSFLNSQKGVTHNYLRDHDYNLWFTLIMPDRGTIAMLLSDIEKNFGISPVELPMAKRFKIGVSLDIE